MHNQAVVGVQQNRLYPDAEIVIGLVAPLGTDLGEVERKLEERFPHFGYHYQHIRLSDLLNRFKLDLPPRPDSPAGLMHRKMDAGNALRVKGRRADALVLAAIGEIQRRRDADEPAPRHCYLLRQLKHPEEVRTLREVYGPGFFLLGVTASIQTRRDYLTKNLELSEDEANELILRDAAEDDRPDGQRTRDTFHLADAFVDLDGVRLQANLWRIVDLLFGNPFHTPTLDEHSMFMAYAASLRSADLSRQVGAVVVRASGEVIGTGANDVPRPGGGLYWPDSDPFAAGIKDDQRDHVQGYDSNARIRDSMLLSIMRSFRDPDSGLSDAELLQTAKEKLGGSGLLNLTEYGRAVHAEMEALLSCARVGVSCRGDRLYTTTFPCHNCAKHIVASGISEVVYVEPYPKSRAMELHGDALSVPALQEEQDRGERVRFRPFEGIGPRRYIDLFSMTLGDGRDTYRKSGDKKVDFDRRTASPRIPMQPTNYIEREANAFSDLNKAMQKETTNG